MSKAFTIEELKKYNGINKKPAYVGYKGKVYNVSNIFNNFPVVGTIISNQKLSEKIFKGSNQKADILLRLALGIVFFAHGGQKLFGWFGGYGWAGTMGFFTQGLHIPALFAGLAILAEFFGGVAILLGFMTRPAALALSVTMIVAALKVHLPNGFFLDSKGAADGIEYAYVLIMLSLYFAVKGAGLLSVDKLIADRLVRK